MNEDHMEGLLVKADERASEPTFTGVTAARIRRRIQQRRFVRMAVPTAAAALVAVAAGLWAICSQTGKPQPEPQRIASLEEQGRQLQAQNDAALKLVQDVLEKDRQDRRLAALQA